MKAEARVIRLGAWSLPAAGLVLGAPWITPYFVPRRLLWLRRHHSGPDTDRRVSDDRRWRLDRTFTRPRGRDELCSPGSSKDAARRSMI
jgi:hypothetical protein